MEKCTKNSENCTYYDTVVGKCTNQNVLGMDCLYDKEHEEGQRHRPGYASLACEVLKEAKQSGVDMELLEHSIWTDYLKLHLAHMRNGTRWGSLSTSLKRRR